MDPQRIFHKFNICRYEGTDELFCASTGYQSFKNCQPSQDIKEFFIVAGGDTDQAIHSLFYLHR